MAAKKAKKPEVAKAEVITAFKGFDKNLQCRGYQFEIGKTHTNEGEVEACSSGFHSCENPLDVLNYYPLISDDGSLNRFASVKASGTISRHDGDSKIASASLLVEVELKLPEFISAAVNWIKAACTTEETAASGVSSQLAASGHYSQLAASGVSSQLAASGHYSQLAASGASSKLAASGAFSQLAASGHSSQLAASGAFSQLAASGAFSQLVASGHSSQLAASGHSSQLAASGAFSQLAASGAFSQLAASGDSSQLVASGHSSQLAASGVSSQLAASGDSSIVCAASTNCKASAGNNGCIVLARWVESEKRYRASVAYVGENGIKPNVFYELDENGNFVEC